MSKKIYRFKKNRQRKVGTKGFTLIEMLIVVSLVLVLAGLSTAVFSGRFADDNVQHYVKDLTAYMRYVQYRAIEHGQVHQVEVRDDGALRSLVDSKGKGLFEEVTDPFVRRLENPGSFELKFEKSKGVLFYPDGAATSNTLLVLRDHVEVASLELTNRVGNIKVQIANTGGAA